MLPIMRYAIPDHNPTILKTDNQDVTGVTEKLKLYKVPINRKPGVPPLTTLKTLLPNLEESKLLAMDESALLAALGISTVQKVAKTCYIGPPIIETNTTADDAAEDTGDTAGASDSEVDISLRFFPNNNLFTSDSDRLRQKTETGWRGLAGI